MNLKDRCELYEITYNVNNYGGYEASEAKQKDFWAKIDRAGIGNAGVRDNESFQNVESYDSIIQARKLDVKEVFQLQKLEKYRIKEKYGINRSFQLTSIKEKKDNPEFVVITAKEYTHDED